MRILVQNRQKKFKVMDSLKPLIERTLLTTLESEKMPYNCELSVVLVNNSSIKKLNSQHRGKNTPTDVLSFPMYDRKTLGKIIKSENYEEKFEILLGDIVISLEKAYEQAEEYGHTFEREIGFLAVHGILHLLGYDHIKEKERLEMRAKEEEILKIIGLTREENGC